MRYIWVHDRAAAMRRDWRGYSFGRRLTWAMERIHIGPSELEALCIAQKLPVTKGAISKASRSAKMMAGRADTLYALAVALDVSPTWLAFGIGEPLHSDVKTSKERAADICREAGVSEDAIADALTEIVIPDASVLFWIDRIRSRESELRKPKSSTVRTTG